MTAPRREALAAAAAHPCGWVEPSLFAGWEVLDDLAADGLVRHVDGPTHAINREGREVLARLEQR